MIAPLFGRVSIFPEGVGNHRRQRLFGLDADNMIFRIQVPADPLRNPLDCSKDDGGQFIGHGGAISQRCGLAIAEDTYGDRESAASLTFGL